MKECDKRNSHISSKLRMITAQFMKQLIMLFS